MSPKPDHEEEAIDLGGDELTRRIVQRIRVSNSSQFFAAIRRSSGPQRLKELLDDCVRVMANNGWAVPNDEQFETFHQQHPRAIFGRFPGDHYAEPFSDLWYAGKIAETAWVLLRSWDDLDPNVLLGRGLDIGSLCTEWHWRSKYKPHIVRGARVQKSGAEGHPKAHGTPEEKADRWGAMASEVRDLIAHGMRKTAAYSLVAEKYGVNEKTVRRHLNA